MKGSEEMDDMASTTDCLLRAILELIDKCKDLNELKVSVKRILKGSDFEEKQ